MVSNAQSYWGVFELSENLSKAMESRAVIEQAKGILMSTRRIDADVAFDVLRERSQASNRKLRYVAADLVDKVSGSRRRCLTTLLRQPANTSACRTWTCGSTTSPSAMFTFLVCGRWYGSVQV